MRSLALVALILPLAGCSESRPRHTWTPPPYAQPQPQTPSYAMPFAVPVPWMPPAAASAAPAPASNVERDACLAEAGTAADCEAALRAAAAQYDVNPSAVQRGAPVYEVYRKACERKMKLQGCGVFKSTAVGEAERPAVELLMICESGRSEACEDVKTKSAPLIAWLSTLKADGCKKGHSALCKNYKECRAGTAWGCRATTPPTAGEVCGCAPKTCEGTLTATASPRKWPDGTTRGIFACGAPAR